MTAAVEGPFATERLARRAAPRARDDAFIWQWLGQALAERCAAINRQLATVVVLSPVENFVAALRGTRPDWGITRAASLPPPGSCDALIVLGLPAVVNDVPTFLKQAHSALRPGGLFLAAFYGGGSWAELRTVLLQAEAAHSTGAAVRVAPMIDAGTAANLLQRAGFALPVVDHIDTAASYADVHAVVRDLRAGNAHAVLRDTRSLPRRAAHAAQGLYQQLFPDPRPGKDGRVMATLQGLFLSGWRAEQIDN